MINQPVKLLGLALCCQFAIATQDDPIDNGKRLQCEGCGRWLQFSKTTRWVYSQRNEPSAPRAGERDAAGIVSASALQLAQKIDQIYDTDLSNHLLAAVQAEHNQHATLIEQRERLVEALKGVAIMLNTNLSSYDEEPWAQRVRAVITTIEQEGEASR